MLTALSEVASSDTGATHLKQVFDQSRRASEATGGDGAAAIASAMVGSRAAAATDELGPQSDEHSGGRRQTTGIDGTSALKLLGGVASIAFATLGKGLSGMSSATIGALFREQRGGWVKQLPGSIVVAVQGIAARDGTSVRAGARAGDRRPRDPRDSARETAQLVAAVAAGRARAARHPDNSRAVGAARGAFLRRRGRRSRSGSRPRPCLAPAPEVKTAPPAETPPAPTAAAEATASARSAQLSPLHFGFASTSLTPQSKENLNQVAVILQANPEVSIRVVSHTDNIGTPESNQALSEARSEAVKTMLVERNIDASRIEAVGAGQDQPIASNDTSAGRAENRRTEITVTDD